MPRRVNPLPTEAATAVYVTLQAIDWLKLLWAPILPHTSEQLNEMLGYDQPIFGTQFTQEVEDARGSHQVLRYDSAGATGNWEATTLAAGQAMRQPSPLFVKLDDETMAEKLKAME